MGFAITWCGVPEPAADDFLQRIGLIETGRTEEMPKSLITVARLETGWRLLWYDKYVCPFLTEEHRREHSIHHDLLCCSLEEHCMASSSEMWVGGSLKWRISHDGSDGPKGLDAAGDLPLVLPQIKEEMEGEQSKEGGELADVDFIFEIPLLVAKSITGFKHDEVCAHIIDGEFQVMSLRGRPNGIFSRLFGK